MRFPHQRIRITGIRIVPTIGVHISRRRSSQTNSVVEDLVGGIPSEPSFNDSQFRAPGRCKGPGTVVVDSAQRDAVDIVRTRDPRHGTTSKHQIGPIPISFALKFKPLAGVAVTGDRSQLSSKWLRLRLLLLLLLLLQPAASGGRPPLFRRTKAGRHDGCQCQKPQTSLHLSFGGLCDGVRTRKQAKQPSKATKKARRFNANGWGLSPTRNCGARFVSESTLQREWLGRFVVR